MVMERQQGQSCRNCSIFHESPFGEGCDGFTCSMDKRLDKKNIYFKKV